ncbi:class I SAM-dependent methyltransferase [Microbacterium sp. HMH0099]|uniref:class I SAM-dependent methyltransferase n=1 Tax=Microbacterium sp. HMH0099 TaxID=3414026 RepID=UPI003BF6D013
MTPVSDYDPRVVDLYDEDNPDGPDHDFYRRLAASERADAVVDLGCGTGLLTVTLAVGGRRVVGVDPSASMLAFARRRDGAEAVQWVHGDSGAIPARVFDLALMTGNVAQHIDDGAWTRTLRDVRDRLRAGAVLAFETRNPGVREWESWATAGCHDRETSRGRVSEWMTVDAVDERRVRFTAYTDFGEGGGPHTETQTLVFRSRHEVESDLRVAGFEVEAVHGDWTGRPLRPDDRLMIFVARAR